MAFIFKKYDIVSMGLNQILKSNRKKLKIIILYHKFSLRDLNN